MLKIGLLTPGFSANERDWAIPALDNLVRALAQRHEVRVFSLRYPHAKGVYPVHDAWIYALGGADLASVRRLPFLAAALRAVLRAHRSRPFDVLHGFWADEAGFLAAAAGRLLKVPSVVSVMGGELVGFADLNYGGQLSALNRLLTRLSLQFGTRVTGGSQFVLDLGRRWRSARPPIHLPLGVDLERFQPGIPPERPPGMQDDGPHLLCVASLVPIKDHPTVLQAFHGVAERHPSSRLHLIGHGPLLPELRRQAQELGRSQSIRFHGKIIHTDLPRFYQSADLHVLASRFESQGMAILEAAASRVPTVGSAVGVLPDLGLGALPVPPGDVAGLRAAIIRLLEDPDRRQAASQEALRLARTRYALPITSQHLIDLYLDLVAGSEPQHPGLSSNEDPS